MLPNSWKKLTGNNLGCMGSIKSCSDIIVIDSGRVIEKGNFESLLAQNGLFAELYNSQRKNFVEEELEV